MLCAVDANEHEFVFHAWCRNLTGINRNPNLPRKEILDGQRPREITKRQIIVEFDQQFRIRIGEEVLPRNFARVNGAKRYRRLVARRNHQLRGAAYVLLSDQQIEVPVGADGGIGIGLCGEHRSLYDQGGDSLFAEELQQTKKLCGQAERQQVLRAPAFQQRLFDLRRSRNGDLIVQAGRKLPGNAMFFREPQQAWPIDAGQQFQKPSRVALERDAFTQGHPLAFECTNVR